ncbi:MAG: 2-oxoacid:acceptor oxidoreductase family protein [Candidatus Omnitrophica bacterium]|nr:2-oxoacid:acceptor oxidoreductase family protein [Candidatus Omnitrophota bacterium]
MRRSTQYAVRSTDKEDKVLIAGFGGQGIMFLGKVIALAASLENREVTYIRSYGAEMRGGTSHCMVKISRDAIPSPIFEKANLSIIMNQPSLDKFGNKIEKKGVLVLNSSLVSRVAKKKGLAIKGLKLNELAFKLGSAKVANIIALGLALRKRPLVKLSSVEEVFKDLFSNKKELLEMNIKALKLGYKNG